MKRLGMAFKIPTIVAAVVALASPAWAADWTIDPAKSTLGFTGTESGASFDGHFTRYSAKITFDPANPKDGHALVIIDMASAQTGDDQRDSALPEGDWFDVADFPQARFEASGFRALGGDRYEALGNLAIRNISKAVTLPFTLDITGKTAAVKGKLDLIRTDYGVGQGSWSAGDTVALQVSVILNLVATQP